MDPVTAFSLAAGIVQVIDISSKALSKCREIHKDGSLAQNRATEEITEYLATTTKRLEDSVHHASSSASKESKDIIDVSQKCSETAAKLLSELRKLKCDAGGGAIQALTLGVRTIRRKKFLSESQESLQKYQDILDTRILARLDSQSILQNVQLTTIDQSVKDLALALSQGRHTVAQLLSEQTVALRKHIDRRFDDQAQRDAIENARKQFKESLFFPEIFARQDNITRSHEGTCGWIFGRRTVGLGSFSPESDPASSSYCEADDGEYDGQSLESDYPYRSSSEGLTENLTTRPWPDFGQWLVQGGVAYWFSGNPGSGKSTLMKYIAREISGFCLSKYILNKWVTEGNLVICSFFFWKLGSSLQKDYTGFLRSILYQIAEQRGDIVPILLGQHTTLESKPGEAHWSAPIYAWTRERLEDAMRGFIVNKPASMRLCLVVDGLDEYDGDEDSLLEMVKYLSRDPGTRICVSSRREQIFRLGFAKSPQLRLHDLNRHDIEKATRERLCPVFERYFPDSANEADGLIWSVTYRSEGVFLWADLMCRDLKSGARNADSMRELRERLDRTPGDIKGLYEHMLNRLEPSYLREAAEYFRLLLAEQSSSSVGLTVLHIACGQEAAWACVLKKDVAHFQSSEFRDSCRKLETRILTRCAGLVEIAQHRNDYLSEIYDTTRAIKEVEVSQARDNVSCYLCYVDFIHRTVAEFLEGHEQFFREPDWEWTARLAICRGRVGVMSLVPIIMSEANVGCNSWGITLWCLQDRISEILATENLCPLQSHRQASHDDPFQLIDQIYDVAHYVFASLNGPDRTLSESYGDEHTYFLFEGCSTITYHLALQDRLGFAAHFGCYEYVSHYMSVTNVSGIDLDHISFCAIVGLDSGHYGSHYEGRMIEVAFTTGWLKIILSCLSHSDPSAVHFPKHYFTKSDTQITKWVLFISCSMKIFLLGEEKNTTTPGGSDLYQQFSQIRGLWKDIVAYFLENHEPDDTSFFSHRRAPLMIEGYNDNAESMVWLRLEETVLAWIKGIFSSADPEFTDDITALLESHSKVDRRSYRSIVIETRPRSLKVLPLTDSQSEILTNAWPTASLSRQAYPLMTTPDKVPKPAGPDAETEKIVRMMLHVSRNRRSEEIWEPVVLSWTDDY